MSSTRSHSGPLGVAQVATATALFKAYQRYIQYIWYM